MSESEPVYEGTDSDGDAVMVDADGRVWWHDDGEWRAYPEAGPGWGSAILAAAVRKLAADLADMTRKRDGWEKATRGAESGLDAISDALGRKASETVVETAKRAAADLADFRAVSRGRV